MNQRGCSLYQLQRSVPGRVSVRILASSRRRWIVAHWRCGCRAEGEAIADLALIERCTRHGDIRMPLPVAG